MYKTLGVFTVETEADSYEFEVVLDLKKKEILVYDNVKDKIIGTFKLPVVGDIKNMDWKKLILEFGKKEEGRK